MLKQCQLSEERNSRPPLPHQDESLAEYSLAGCSPAEPASASSAMLILNQKLTVGYCFSANGTLSPNFTVSSHDAGQHGDGVVQPNGSKIGEPRIDVKHVANAVSASCLARYASGIAAKS